MVWGGPSRSRSRRARGAALLTAVALLGSTAACDGGGDSGGGGQEARPAPGTGAGAGAADVPRSPSERLGLDEGWGPDRAELDRAARQVGRLRLPDLAGQVIVASWDGTQAPVPMVRDLHLGGVIAFDPNVTSAAQISAVNRALTRQAGRRGWPLFLGVDQEGGVVERLRRAATRFPAFMSAGAARDTDLTERTYAASGRELRRLGFTVDFAPDADVTSGPDDPTIGSRSASSDPARVGEQVVAAARGFEGSRVLPVIKHFPGHGSVPADSHLTLPVQTKSLEQLEATDLVPFRTAVEAGLPAVMVGHLDVRAVDPRVPASLSRRVVTGLLRDELGFGGLVVTDALDMAGVTRGRDPGRNAVQAVRAGADVLLMPPSPAAARAALVRAVRSGDLPRRRLEQAAARQVALLTHLRDTSSAGQPAGGAVDAASPAAASRALSAAAITVTDGPCSGPLVGASVYPHGDPAAVATFDAAAARAGLVVLQRRAAPSGLTESRPRPERRRHEGRRHFRQRVRDWKRVEARREQRLARWSAREDARLAAGTSVGFTGYHDVPVDGDVAVATDSPWVLGRVGAPTRVATYGDTPAAMDVLVEVLRGEAPAPGRLPVRVAGVQRRGC
ncbi:glycoside hydrolase family 3 protein [Nocardioides zeicaulis]|uniref:beta-N-acetylhexosaminidase n=1 Tax=Nocardioides zeicaulis TaxID=1776857 RepID=A0ABV6E6B4_9ACTN